MNANMSLYQYRQRYVISGRQLCNEDKTSINNRFNMKQLRRYQSQSKFSFYDNDLENKDETIISKWTIVRQRLPDILALSTTYKPTSIRTQLLLLIALMNRQSNSLHKLSTNNLNDDLSCNPTSVIINISGRNRLIYLKRIPPQQMIHVDVDSLSFSIPTRQFIIAISRGDAYNAASKFCPPAITDMLIDLSKTKVVGEGLLYQQTLFKRRIGKMLFFALFIFIIGMMLILMISTVNTLLQLNSLNYTTSTLSIRYLSSNIETDEYWRWR
ncbi:unnamed protein product [Rotaria sordida]|uniref:Uncharacterized protein n=1 Tax=Rotaria sordida TaxID=392033 RepID=A0A814CNT8_9BILA|nr:unnamed protein product [Rotaria sordida]CAF0975881.1 unnamed protein product [Rotaria sordida]CAF1211916.1 unnamed protein product [Rotaria sordida]CAF3626204.1 unnamed protein product [Rotaria sordida]